MGKHRTGQDLDMPRIAIRFLIDRFVQRQRLVLDALRELRPDLVYAATNVGRVAKPQFVDEYTRLTRQYAHVPHRGYWWGSGGEWAYTIHGMGCHLTHVETREPIEWDLPDPKAFDRYWFFNWLEWFPSQTLDEETLADFSAPSKVEKRQERIFRKLAQLQKDGVLSSPDDSNKYVYQHI